MRYNKKLTEIVAVNYYLQVRYPKCFEEELVLPIIFEPISFTIDWSLGKNDQCHKCQNLLSEDRILTIR